ncbi:hypothetical protein WN51_05765 [Melipona quadrifasciata]|uniref:Uncharacterized protein n=1 Tax=Melipona quadrifasciata TaxID=166423 RepID=A0A0M9A892_9HYME|nr:hypothetical protein WN51_05765 [Melipona quadrifasciata]
MVAAVALMGHGIYNQANARESLATCAEKASPRSLIFRPRPACFQAECPLGKTPVAINPASFPQHSRSLSERGVHLATAGHGSLWDSPKKLGSLVGFFENSLEDVGQLYDEEERFSTFERMKEKTDEREDGECGDVPSHSISCEKGQTIAVSRWRRDIKGQRFWLESPAACLPRCENNLHWGIVKNSSRPESSSRNELGHHLLKWRERKHRGQAQV